MNERRQHFRMEWLQLPKVKRWEDGLPDFSRRVFIDPIVSVPRQCFFTHVSGVLQTQYTEQRATWRNSHIQHDYKLYT
jgi:hypothetical protein